MKHPIFVYGTVMSCGYNHYLVNEAIYSGETLTTEKHFDLVDMPMFPAAIYGANQVRGELYLASPQTLKHLDMLENNGSFYQRTQIEVEDFPELVWMYMLMDDVMDTDVFGTISPVDNVVNWKPK